MKPASKLSLVISGLFLIAPLAARWIIGEWMFAFYIFLALAAAGLIFVLVNDYKFYLEFLSMKTAKNSLSLGWSLCFLLIFLFASGFLGLRFNKTFDFTKEGLNSLAPQSRDILQSLDKDLHFLVFYNGDKISPEARFIKEGLNDGLALYKQASFKVKIRFIDSYAQTALSEKYLSSQADKAQKEIFVFAEYDGKFVRADEPFREESFTSAIIKAKKRGQKEIYFLVGHGERDLRDTKPGGLQAFENYLQDSAFSLKEWNFIQDGKPPEPPALVLIVGPRRPFLQEEEDWLADYLKKGGGRVLMALDPGEKHNLKGFLKREFAVDFQDNFIISQIGFLYGSPARAAGLFFDNLHPVTKRFQSGRDAAFFDRASAVDLFPEAAEKHEISHLLKSHAQSFTVPRLTSKIRVGKMNSLSMALEIASKEGEADKESETDDKAGAGEEEKAAGQSKKELSKKTEGGEEAEKAGGSSSETKEKKIQKKSSEKETEKAKKFRLIVFGDSDFLTNKDFYKGVNRDLILNAAVSLLDEEELASIRPKTLDKTEITLTRNHRLGLVIFFIVIPLVFLFAAVLLYFKRRES